jgi:hypothetical protein
MPLGKPNSSELNRRKAYAFSLDTSVIEAAGFRFDEGALKHLSRQLPPWIELWMTDIVIREVSNHRIENVSRSVQNIHTGLQDLRRHIGGAFNQSIPDWLRTTKDTATHLFNAQFEKFLSIHSGIVLRPDCGNLASDLFDMYFQVRPPFGGGRDKKHEFPDAASLLMLESMAAERSMSVILVSKDDGWKQFAEQSKHLYFVDSLSALCDLFLSESREAKFIQERLRATFEKPSRELRGDLKSAIERGLNSTPWELQFPILPGWVFEGNVVDLRLESFEPNPTAIGVWITSAENETCAAEMPIDVVVYQRLDIEARKTGYFGEPLAIENIQVILQQSVEVKVHLEMRGALLTGSPEHLIAKMELADSPTQVLLTRSELGPNWAANKGRGLSPFDDMDDDIPF